MLILIKSTLTDSNGMNLEKAHQCDMNAINIQNCISIGAADFQDLKETAVDLRLYKTFKSLNTAIIEHDVIETIYIFMIDKNEDNKQKLICEYRVNQNLLINHVTKSISYLKLYENLRKRG